MNKEEWQEMTTKQKFEYLATYYWWVLMLVIVGIIVIVNIVKMVTAERKEEINSGTTVNIGLSEEGRKFLQDDYVVYTGNDTQVYQSSLSTEFVSDPTKTDSTDDGSEKMALVVHLQAGMYYYMIMDEYAYKDLQGSGIYADLEEIMDAETLEKYKDDLVDCTYNDDEESITYKGGLKLSNTEFYKEYKMNDTEMYFVVVKNMGETERGKAMLDYILSK